MDEEKYACASHCLQSMTSGCVLEFRGMPKEVARLHPWRQLEQWREQWRVHAESEQCARQYEHEHWVSLRPVRFLASLGQNPLAAFAPTDQDLSAGASIAKKAYGHVPLSFGRQISGLYLRRVPCFFEHALTAEPVGPC